MPEQEVEMSPSGEFHFKLPQRDWSGNEAMQSAYFAGQHMIFKRFDDEYELYFLRLKVGQFADIDDAKINAPHLPVPVFQILDEFIKDS